MSTEKRKHVRPLAKRGGLLCIPIPRDIESRLGWNWHDNVTYDVVEGSLIITRVKLPTVEHLRARAHSQENGEL